MAAKLVVKLHGTDVTKITLESGVEYIAGRAQDAQIQLANERGISRHHLKFYEREGVWVCESLSKFVQIQMGSEAFDLVELKDACAFSVPPYEFHFEPEVSADQAEASKSENLPTPFQPRMSAQKPMSDEHTSAHPSNEATMAGSAALVPYMRINYPNTADDEVLKLEGHLWVAGRDPACEIAIDSSHISRKHFELARTQEGFFITDLGSSNGTKINGQQIPPHEPTRLESGDEIRIMSIAMYFEIRDSQFSNRMDALPVPAFNPALAAPPMPVWAHYNENEPTQMRDNPMESMPEPKKFEWRKTAVRVALLGAVGFLALTVLLPSKKSTEPIVSRDPSQNVSVVFDSLKPEQKSVVKDSFGLARNLYVQGKYELCLTELAKVHDLIPQYENSKELQSFCEQGRDLVIRTLDQQRKEREREMIEQQISGHVENCKQKLKSSSTVEETRKCLADAIELNPEHHLVTEMIQTAQMHEEEAAFRATQRAVTDRKAGKGEEHYRRVKALAKDGNLAKAIREYEKFLNASYPRIEDEKAQARRELASIKKDLKSKIDYFVDQCKTLGGANKLKDAWTACDQAVKLDPSQQSSRDLQQKMHQALRKEMKAIYEDSVLEESLGNVDSAKEKWHKIVRENIASDDYTAKAKSKLKKYEGQ